MTDAEQTQSAPESAVPPDTVQAAIERLLNFQPEPDEDEAPAPQPAPKAEPDAKPEQETDDDAPASEPSAEVEGGLVEQKTAPADKAETAERKDAPKAVETPSEKTQDATQQDQLLAQLNILVPQLQAAINGEFADIKSFEDLQKVAAEDPARYNRYVIHQAQLQHVQSEQQRLAADAHGRWYQSEAQKLSKLLPDMADPVKGPALKNELRQFALKSGFDEQRLMRASAADVVTLHKAMQFDRLQAAQKAKPAEIAEAQAKAKEKAAKAPPVSKPGVAQEGEKKDRVQEKAQRFQKTGKIQDLATLLTESGLA